MHLELPKARLDSLKDFAKHYLMIVLSILTALGLEAWIEHVHHAEAAQVAVARMNHELHDNLAGIDDAFARNQTTLGKLRELERRVRADIASGQPDAQINADIHAHRDLFVVGINFPTQSTDAWDVAVANQSAGWIDASSLERYSSAYSADRALTSWVQHDAMLMFNGPQMVDVLSDLQLGNPVAPRPFLYDVIQLISSVGAAQVEIGAVRDELRKDLGVRAAATAG
ncbi:MAG: hypothetical protein KGN77_13675 [Xanthomonadaceae bacterium]|nr:hypothetical protein [Xanthomonadaceae bacterium]MDE1965326.1 hypothetical protein [Xanthomonadaceae bacterium]